MKKIKWIFIFVILLFFVSFVILGILGYKSVSDKKAEDIQNIQKHIALNKEYVQTNDFSISNREIYLNYDEDGLDNNSELRESTSIYYWDSDNDGLSDDLEIEHKTNPLKTNTNTSVSMKDGTLLYLYNNDASKKENAENLSIVDDNLGITVTKINYDAKALGVIQQESGEYINNNAEKAFLLKNINLGAQVSVKSNSSNPYIIAIDKFFKNKNVINFSKNNGELVFAHNGQELIYIIGDKEKIGELENKDFIIIKSELFGSKIKIYEKSKGLTKNKDFTLNENDLQLPENYKLKFGSLGKIKGLLVSSVTNNYNQDIYGNSTLSQASITTSTYELGKNINFGQNDFLKKNTFNIDNFSTELVRQNVGAGLAYSLNLYNKEIKNNAKHDWDTTNTLGVVTTYDFTRDLNGYSSLLNNEFGKYRFNTLLSDRQNLDTTFNPDQQVLKFIEMYNDVFEKSKNWNLLPVKYSADNIQTVLSSIDRQELPIFGIKTSNGGIYLTGYKYEVSEFSNNVYKIYVYDPNFKQNTLENKDISDRLILYLVKTPSWKIKGNGDRELKYSLEFYYNPFNLNTYTFSNIDNRSSDLDIFVF